VAHKINPVTAPRDVRAVHYAIQFEGDGATYHICVTENTPGAATDPIAACGGTDATSGNCVELGRELGYVHLNFVRFNAGDNRYEFEVVRGVGVSPGLPSESVGHCYVPVARRP
jgi:hypothetical protein